MNSTPTRSAYHSQRQSARRRGVDWHFTFEQWEDVWIKSGRWSQRGRKKGQFCMARDGDCGPYAAWNVGIQEVSKNTSDGRSRGDPLRRIASRMQSARGWTFVGGRNPYQVYVSKKYVGCFSTEEAAVSAYRAAASVHLGGLGA